MVGVPSPQLKGRHQLTVYTNSNFGSVTIHTHCYLMPPLSLPRRVQVSPRMRSTLLAVASEDWLLLQGFTRYIALELFTKQGSCKLWLRLTSLHKRV